MKKLILVFIVSLVIFQLTQATTSAKDKGVFFGREDIPEFRSRFQSDPMFASLKAKLEGIDKDAERKFFFVLSLILFLVGCGYKMGVLQ